MNADQAWQAAVGHLQMDIPKATFDTWVRDAELIAFEDGTFIIGVQNAYARDWLENRLSSTITRVLTGIMDRTIEVRFVVWQPTWSESEHITSEPVETTTPTAFANLPLNTYYIYDLISNGTSWYVIVRNAFGAPVTITNPVTWASVQNLGNNFWFYWGEVYTDQYWADQDSDWVYLRDYVDPEPLATLGGEEPLP